MSSVYYDSERVAAAVHGGQHRGIIGGMWEEIGTLQLKLLQQEGLKPHHRLLDIGCGSLRGGVKIVPYLNTDNYFGFDINESLIDAGYQREFDEFLRGKCPRGNFMVNSNFDFSSFGMTFDFALALSVFTHLPLNNIRICLENLADVMAPGGRFVSTFFEVPENERTGIPRTHSPGSITTNGAADPYHYKVTDLKHAAHGLPWDVRYVGEIGHPRGQRVIVFEWNDHTAPKGA